MKTTSNRYPLNQFVPQGETAQAGQDGNYGDTGIKDGRVIKIFFSIKTMFPLLKNLHYNKD